MEGCKNDYIWLWWATLLPTLRITGLNGPREKMFAKYGPPVENVWQTLKKVTPSHLFEHYCSILEKKWKGTEPLFKIF